jgi:hypothetical protein
LTRRIGNYLLEREIGRGGTGEVWLARHELLEHRQVAIKILITHERETVQRFIREAKLTSRLHHPNIVQVFDHGYYPADKGTNHLHCTIMEYVPGSSLQHLLDTQHHLSLQQAFTIFRQVADALDYAHSLQVIHRDVSPGNILVTQAGDVAKLTDFGIAREPSQKLTVDYSIMGTPGYWSPEHTRSATEVTSLSDIYSLGVVLYAMLSGDLPWDTLPGPADRVFAPPLPLRARGVQNMPADVDRVIQTMLANDPTRRFPTAQAAIEELERVLSRHQVMTLIAPPGGGSAAPEKPQQQADASSVALHPSAFCIAEGVQQNAVEDVLGAGLVRSVITRAHQRAAELSQPAEVARLLNAWSARGRFRRAMLGRLARLHRISSRNVYFYHLSVVYEQRGEPQTIEEPDHQAQVFPLEPEMDRWSVKLPLAAAFSDDAGSQEVLPGSTRVVKCPQCEGKGKLICPRCKGKQRIYVTRTPDHDDDALDEDEDAEEQPPTAKRRRTTQNTRRSGKGGAAHPAPADGGAARGAQPERVLEPCPECEGSGGLRCERCDGVGRLVQRKAFRWQRVARAQDNSDEISEMDDKWLAHYCDEHEVYHERAGGDELPKAPALRQEWMHVPVLCDMVKEALDATDEYTRIVLSEVTITLIPITDIVFDLKQTDETQAADDEHDKSLYRLSIYGFERVIPPDWRLLNWERVIFLYTTLFLLVMVILSGYFLFFA